MRGSVGESVKEVGGCGAGVTYWGLGGCGALNSLWLADVCVSLPQAAFGS